MGVQGLKKTGYHHGDLRSALIAAGRRIAETEGDAAVTIARAAKAAGVSATAPYRHFRDRADFFDAIAASIFEDFEKELLAARASEPEGSAEAIIAIGRVYVKFHLARRGHYDLLWGDDEHRGPDCACAQIGPRCFAVLLGAIDAYRARHDLGHLPTPQVALPLWAMVHGLANLAPTHAFSRKAEGTSVDLLIEQATNAFLDGLEARATRV